MGKKADLRERNSFSPHVRTNGGRDRSREEGSSENPGTERASERVLSMFIVADMRDSGLLRRYVRTANII